MVHHPSPTGHLCTAVVVHRRHAGRIEEWGERCFPWVRLQVGEVVVAFVSVYLLYTSRAGYAGDIRKNLDELDMEFSSIRTRAGHLVIAGEYNLAQWRYAHAADARRGRQVDARMTSEFEAIGKLTDLSHTLRLGLLEPDGGFVDTFTPYRTSAKTSCLDDFLVSRRLTP